MTFRPSSVEQALYYWGLPALMALGSLLLIFVSQRKYGDVAAQVGAFIMLLTLAWFFLGYSGGV